MDKYIYIAKAVGHDDIYKVGESVDPISRMDGLKVEYKCEFELMFKEVQTSYGVERDALAMLAKYRSDIFGEGRREVFNAEYREILNYVIYANTPDREEGDIDYIVSWFPRLIEEAGETSGIYNDKYKIQPIGDDAIILSRVGSGGIDWSLIKTGWSSDKSGCSIEWLNEDEIIITSQYGGQAVMCGGDFETILGALTSITKPKGD